MPRKFFLLPISILTLAVLSCSLTGQATQAISPTNAATNLPEITAASVTPAVPSSPTASPTPPQPADTDLPTNTLAPAASSTPLPQPGPSSNDYIDDRSTPSQVIVSLYNAINRQEYLRAYNYWNNPADSLGSYTSYAAGYQDTKSVGLVFGQITADAGMSQVYYTIPVILKTTSKNGTRTNYAACYVVHAAAPGVFGAPPFIPMGIERGSAKASDINTNESQALATACIDYPTGPYPVPAAGTTLNIGKNNFLDNRSGPIETVSSLLNAINLKQYVRAYYYFDTPANFPGPFEPYAAGYSETDLITVSFGSVQSQGAAGSTYYKVPLALHVQTASSTEQIFVGCYTLRLANPTVQGVPPFRPMGITVGKFDKVNASSDVNTLLSTACN
jgi:hypothetical protein